MDKANSIIRLSFFHPNECDGKEHYNFIFIDTGELVIDCPLSEMKGHLSNIICFEWKPLDDIAEDHIGNLGIHDTFEPDPVDLENSFFYKIAQKARDFFLLPPYQPLHYDMAFNFQAWVDHTYDGSEWNSSYELIGFVKKIDIHVQPLEEGLALHYEKEKETA